MKWMIGAVKDEMAGENGVFMTPTIQRDFYQIERAFDFAINNEEIMKQNPTDFSLYKIGTFDDETGNIEVKVQKMITGATVLRKERND